jgi:ribosomal peptide maturation radical SAM protein 1
MQPPDPDLRDVIAPGDALIVVPPFVLVDRPSLAAHVLQASARAQGFRVSVLYASMLLAATLEDHVYESICAAAPLAMVGERFFARAAHGLPLLGGHAQEGPRGLFGGERIARTSERMAGRIEDTGFAVAAPPDLGVDLDELRRLAEGAGAWADRVAAAIAALPFRIVGATTTFEQTNASFAILSRVKRLRPDVITILGGANCEGEMARGVASIGGGIDFVFSGESDVTFPALLRAAAAGDLPRERVVPGAPFQGLGGAPTPDFREYFEQRARWLGPRAEARPVEIPYETSRGCWWGQKHHCTFCGLNGEGMGYREKPADRVVADLRAIAAAHGTRRISMTDNIMPRAYFRTLLPRLAAEPERFDIFYEQKANLSLADVRALKDAGVTRIQPGMEALSSSLLRRMDKGVLARQNLMLLRYARSVGIGLEWNLLWGLPGDEPQAYDETLALMPLLRHLPPPVSIVHISIDRFSPYFEESEAHGISNVRPHPVYEDVFPPHADHRRLAYRFVGDYESGAYARLGVVAAIAREQAAWWAAWRAPGARPPVLRAMQVGEHYVVRDTRGLPGAEEVVALDRREAAAALVAAPLDETDAAGWAVERKLGVRVDGWYVPLATASPALLEALEAEGRPARRAPAQRRALPIAGRAAGDLEGPQPGRPRPA